jgi:hypothetical protein
MDGVGPDTVGGRVMITLALVNLKSGSGKTTSAGYFEVF